MAVPPDDESTEELMPMLKALRRAKLRVELNGESARVSFRNGDSRCVEADDLVYEYACGRLPLDLLVARVLERLRMLPR